VSTLSYDKVKERLNHIDKLGLKELEMQNVDEKSHKEMSGIEQELDAKHTTLLNGIESINIELHSQIEILESRIDKKNQELRSIMDFKSIPNEVLDAERNELEEKLNAIYQKYELQRKKLLNRHDAVLKNSTIRLERKINAADASAANVMMINDRDN
jgi:phosphoglycerate-specific signal transduction histidine kinase